MPGLRLLHRVDGKRAQGIDAQLVELRCGLSWLDSTCSHYRYRVMPTSVCRNQRISLFRPPAAGLVGVNPVVLFEDRIDHRPGGLNRILAGKKRAIAGHGGTQQPLVGRFLSRLFIQQVELALVADELLASALDARGKGNSGVGRKPEAKIIGPPDHRR